MKINHLLTVALLSLVVTGCATWSTSSIDTSAADNRTQTSAKSASDVKIYETDVANRRYESLGDISVSVNKTTLLHPSPTQEKVDEKLREEAGKLGADAVIFVSYGKVGVSLVSWGSLEGRGRAIRFLD